MQFTFFGKPKIDCYFWFFSSPTRNLQTKPFQIEPIKRFWSVWVVSQFSRFFLASLVTSPGISDLNMAIEKQHNDGSGFAPLDYYIKYSVAWLLRMLMEN